MHFRQAIRTRYHGPSNQRGSRVSAQCEAGRVYVEYDDALNLEANHKAACDKLAVKLGWADARYYGARLAGWFGGDAYWVEDDKRLTALAAVVNSMRAATWTGNPWSKAEFRDAVAVIGRSFDFHGDPLEAPTTPEEAAKLQAKG